MSKAFSPSGNPPPGSVSLGLRWWDRLNAYATFLAPASVIIACFLAVWLALDLSQFWAQADSTMRDKASIAQLISAAIVGGVAIDVFLLAQLPLMLRPRVHACFLRRDPKSDGIDHFFEEYVYEETLRSGDVACLHIRIANVGTTHLSKLSVRMNLPSEVRLEDEIPPGTGWAYDKELFRARQAYGNIYLPVRDDPIDTAPGAATVHHVLVKAPKVESSTILPLRLRISSDKAYGFIEKRLWLRVTP